MNELLFPLPSSAVETTKCRILIVRIGFKICRVTKNTDVGNQTDINFHLPGVGEYPNVLTSCWGPTLLEVDFVIGDHNFTVPSAEADNNCW